MHRIVSLGTLGAAAAALLSACGGGGRGPASGFGPPPPPVSYIGTTGVFAAWVDPGTGRYADAPTGTYAGKKQILRGTLDFTTGAQLAQPAGVEIYKGDDGHIFVLDLTTTSTPAQTQVSSEAAATVDDTCTLSGTAVPGANTDYVGVYFTADLVLPTNSSYFYRLPGPDGVCDTPDDVIHMVKTGMSASAAPITAFAMPIATVRTARGGIQGFIAKSGASLVELDVNFQNPIVLGTFAQAIGVASALPVGATQGFPSGQLFDIDGSIYYVDYAAHAVSAALATIPNWSATDTGALFAASASTLYMAINTPASGATPAATTLYAVPASGSGSLAIVDTEPGRIATLVVPIGGSNPIWGVVDPNYTIRTLVAGAPATLVTSTQNAGTFIATSSTVYYETWSAVTDAATLTVSHSGTQSGIVGLDGTVLQPPLVSSTFVAGGEQFPWPADPTVTQTPYETVFQVRGLSSVSVSNPSTGYTYVEDAVSGGTLLAIDTATNQFGTPVGTLPPSTATTLSGTFRGPAHVGFLEAANALSTEDPATRDLYLLSSQQSGSLVRLTPNL